MIRSSERRIRLALFVFVGLLFLSYRSYYWKDSLQEEYLQVLINTLCDTGLVYVLYSFMGPLSKRFQSKKLLFFGVWFILGLLASNVAIGIHYLVHLSLGTLTGNFREVFAMLSFQIFDAYVVIFVGLGISSAFRWYHAWSAASILLGELEREKALTELAYLKSQINPHFVFNTLNSIYFLIHPENESAREALHKFSQMLRYQLYESSNPLVTIEEELHYLNNYIALQRLRLDERYLIHVDIQPDIAGFSIPPLLLIIPVENAFKHISHHSDQKNEVWIQAEKTDSYFLFKCQNSCSKNERPVEVGGIGLNNLKRRLELLYDERSAAVIDAKEGHYSLSLKIPIA